MNTFSDPNAIIKQLELHEDFHVADFGSGAGAYSIPLAKELPQGKVFAIDVQKDMVDRLQNEAHAQNLHNIHVVWGDVDEERGSRLRDESVDLVVVANVLFQAEKKKTLLEEALRILKPDGRILILDWSESFGNIGPAQDFVVKEDTARLLVEEVGFNFEKDLEPGAHHYAFIARKL